jgi:hypothetical protein
MSDGKHFYYKLNAKLGHSGKKRLPKYAFAPEAKILPHVDLRPFDNHILDQGQEGDCTAAASLGVWLFCQIAKWRVQTPNHTPEELAQFKTQLMDPSLDFSYAMELLHDGDFGEDNGSYGSTAAWALSNVGVCPASVWPNTGFGYQTRPSIAAIQAAKPHEIPTYSLRDLDSIRLTHSEGFPTFFGVPVYSSWINNPEVMRTGVIQMPGAYDQQVGGHEIKSIGHDDEKGWLIIANSWSTAVGDQGHFYLPYDYVREYASDIHTARPK